MNGIGLSPKKDTTDHLEETISNEFYADEV